MNWFNDDKNRAMERLCRLMNLTTILIVCFLAMVTCFLYPKDAAQKPVKAALVLALGTGCALCCSFWVRSKVRKSGVRGDELYTYWMRKPFGRLVQLIVAISVIISLYKMVRGH